MSSISNYLYLIIRITNTLKIWLDQHPKDFEDRQSLFVKQFYTLVSHHISKTSPQQSEHMCNILDGKVTTFSFQI